MFWIEILGVLLATWWGYGAVIRDENTVARAVIFTAFISTAIILATQELINSETSEDVLVKRVVPVVDSSNVVIHVPKTGHGKIVIEY